MLTRFTQPKLRDDLTVSFTQSQQFFCTCRAHFFSCSLPSPLQLLYLLFMLPPVWNRLLFEIIIFFPFLCCSAANNSTIFFPSFFHSLAGSSVSSKTYELGVRMVEQEEQQQLRSERTDERRKSSGDALTHPRKKMKRKKMPANTATFYFSSAKKQTTRRGFFSSFHLTCSASVQLHFCSADDDSQLLRWQRGISSLSSPSSARSSLHRSQLSIRLVRYLIIHILYTIFLLPPRSLFILSPCCLSACELHSKFATSTARVRHFDANMSRHSRLQIFSSSPTHTLCLC